MDQGAHDELLARSDTYHALLAGLEEDLAAQVGDRIEALAAMSSAGRAAAPPRRRGTSRGYRAARRPPRATPHHRAAQHRPRPRRRRRGWRLNLAPTPELLARVDALPPVRDVPAVELGDGARQDRGFNLRRLLGEFRRPLLGGLVLVVLDALASLAGPVLVKTGLDSGVAKGSLAVVFGASAVYLAVTLADLVDEIVETFVTGRTAQRIMLSLRVRIWAQLQRLSLDYYEREMAGRIMTRMTTDVDQFESLIENGLLSALVSIVTFVGVGVALVVLNPELGLCTLSVVVPLVRRHGGVPAPGRPPLRPVPGADRHRQRRLPGEPVRGPRGAGLRPRGATKRRFHRLGHDYLESRVAAQRLVATYFPFVQFLSSVADAIVLGRGRRAHRHRASGLGRADRLHPLHRPFLLPHPAALPGLRLLAADTGLRAPDLRAHAAGDAHPQAADPRGRAGWPATSPRQRPLRLPAAGRAAPGRPRRARPSGQARPSRRARAAGDAGRPAARGAARHRPADRSRARRWPWWARRGRASRR